MLACSCTGNIFIRCAHSLASHSPSKEIGGHSWLELQIFRICRAWLTQHLLMSMANPQNPGVKKWFGIPVPFSSCLFEVKGHACQTRVHSLWEMLPVYNAGCGARWNTLVCMVWGRREGFSPFGNIAWQVIG